jgi:DNA-binding NarL/FixJ family response regulator
MTALPQIDLVAEGRDMTSLLRIGSQIQPDLIVIEAGLSGLSLAQSITYMKTEWPKSRTMILVDDIHQQHEAQEATADVVLFKGYRAATLMNIVERLLTQKGDLNRAAVAAKPCAD